MLKQQNSTGATGNATELTCAAPVAAIDAIANDIEKRDGLLARAQASKQLCAVLLDQFERQLAWGRGEPTSIEGVRSFRFSSNALETMRWVLSEAWETTGDLAAMVDTLQNDLAPIADSAFAARKAAKSSKAVAA